MFVQLTIHQPGAAKDDFFKPAKRCEFEQNTIVLGGKEAHCQIPGAEENLAEISREKNKFLLKCLSKTAMVQANGKKMQLGEKRVLHSGDLLTLCSCPVNFYVSFKKSPVSWQSNAFAMLAKTGIAIVLFLQLICIFILPKLLNRGQFWSGQQKRLNIIARTDQLRKNMQEIDNPDPIAKIIIKACQQDLAQRTTYLRAYSAPMTRSQRERMWQALEEVEKQMQFLKTARLDGTIPPLKIDRPIADIIEKSKHE